jgi:predicted transposase YdaD
VEHPPAQEAFLYVLLEHQSTLDPLMPFRMLRYVVRIWDTYLRATGAPRRLPAIIPVVVHQGAVPWTGPTELSELLNLGGDLLGDLGALIPRFRFHLDDLALVDEEAVRRRKLTAVATMAIVLLQWLRSTEDALALLERYILVLEDVARGHDGRQRVAALLEYVIKVGEIGPDALRDFVHRLGPVAEEAYVTTAQKLTEEALARGRAEGKAEGKAELVLRQLSLRFGPLSDAVSERVHGAAPGLLDTWAEKVLTASTLDDVFA